MATIDAGDDAPDFTLATDRGEQVQLSAALRNGPVVLIFYPMDNTPGCTAQLCAVRDDGARYAAANVTVWGINNAGASSHAGFAQKHGFSAPLLVDEDLRVAKQYDALAGLGPLRFIKRTVVGIEPSGKIVFYKRGSPSTDEILRAVDPA